MRKENGKRESPYKGILKFADEKKPQLSFAVVLSVLSSAFGIVPYIAVAILLQKALASSLTTTWAILLPVIALCGYLLKHTLYAKSTLCSHKVAYEIIKNIRTTIMKKMSKVSMGTIQGKSSGEFKQLVIDDAERLEGPLAHAIPEMTASILVPIFVILYLLVIDWRMALAALVSAILGNLIYYGMMFGRGEVMKEYMVSNANMNATIVEYVNGMEVIKAFNQTASSMGRFQSAVLKVRDITTKWYKHCWPFMSISQAILPSSIAFVLPVGMALISGGAVSLAELIVCILLSMAIVGSLQNFTEFWESFAVISEVQPRIQALLDMEELSEPAQPKRTDKADVQMKDVHFGYGDSEIIHGISFTAKAGSVTAFVGPSGSGKSTLAKLIARFWDVDGGKITIGGVDVRDYTLDSLLTNISEVFQKVYLFADTIENNIKFGNPAASHEEVVKAAQKACCHEFIMSLPDGYGTVIGEGGATLSGGEKQRISIARAILKDAPIIILDEATSSVDPENENLLMGAIAELTKNKTVIMIAHRLKTVRNADQIFVLSGGHIVQTGKHEDLIRKPGIYADFIGIRKKAIGWKLK